MYPNINSGLGKLMAEQLVNNAAQMGSVGRFFLVFPSTLANASELKAMYSNYADGVSVTYTTLGGASAACVAGRGDVIFLMPGHTETISSSTALTLSIAGVTIIGLGLGGNRPAITLDTANTATINVTANNIVFKNVVFIGNFLAIASLFTLTTAKDFQLINCDFRDTSAVLDFLFIVTTAATSNAADGLTITGCRIASTTAAGVQGLVSFLGTNDRVNISGNTYFSVSTNPAALIPIATGKIRTNLQVLNNYFVIKNAAGTATGWLITTDGTTNTGIIDGNKDGSLITSPVIASASSGFRAGLNYHVDVADLSMYLVPAADS